MKAILFAFVCVLCLTGCGKTVPEETLPPTEAPLPVVAAEAAVETAAPTETEPQEERFLQSFCCFFHCFDESCCVQFA